MTATPETPASRPAPNGRDSLADSLRAGWRAMATDWWQSWVDVARSNALVSDLIAGLTVAAVALPLNVALAVASGLPPIAGLIAGAVGGGIAAAFGGARLQVSGPAAALSVMVLALAQRFGVTGVAAAAFLIGVVQIVLSLAQAGRLGKLVPESVLAGFTTGVGLKLLDSQIPEVLGFNYRVSEIAQMMHRPAWLHHVSWIAVVSGLFVAFLVSSTRHLKRFPAAIVGIGLVTAVSIYLHWDLERVGAVPANIPRPAFPLLPDERWIDLAAATFPLAILAAVESLLSARAIDRMTPEAQAHNPNLELFGQGLANMAVGLLQGMPVTGVIVRSGVNVQSGGRTRLAALVHGVLLATAVLLLGRTIAQVPLAALGGLLCVVGVRLVEVKTLIELARTERIEAAAFALTAVGTVTGHLVIGLVGGLALHAVHAWLHRHEHAERARLTSRREKGIRAVLGRDEAKARRPSPEMDAPGHQKWLAQIKDRAMVSASSFVHRQASVIGRVVMGDNVHIAAGSSVRADEGSPFFIGSNTNLQDGVVVHALKNKWVTVAGEDWAVYVGRNVSIAHNALVHGPCYIGDDTFVGFKAVVHDAVVGSHCYIGIGAVVVGVEVPDGRLVPHGTIVDSADAVARLPLVGAVHREFNEDVVEVNRGLVAAYRELEGGGEPERPRAPEAERRGPDWDQRWQPRRDPARF
ncbi:MAG: hypothetical protein JWM10_256 [Myxococcaceae bacterium]|nr:hypothetical protein [Myxococcaceae bacterium]